MSAGCVTYVARYPLQMESQTWGTLFGMYQDELTGHRLRVAMVDARLTQQQLADLTGYGINTVGRHMRGDTAITVPQLMRYAKALGVAPGTLLPRLDSNQQPAGYVPQPEPSLAEAS